MALTTILINTGGLKLVMKYGKKYIILKPKTNYSIKSDQKNKDTKKYTIIRSYVKVFQTILFEYYDAL